MPVLYRSEDVSFSDGFYEPATIKALGKGAGCAILECFGGLTREEFEPFRETAYNQLKVQPSVAECWDLFVAFVPSEDTVAAIFKAFKANGKCHLSERTPFTQISLPTHSTYSFIISPEAKKDVFTRHPITGVVRRHQHPYTDLPNFTLSAHPCIMAEVGRRTFRWRLAPPILTKYFLYTTVRCFCNTLPFWTKPPKTLCVPSSHSSSLQSSLPSNASSASQSTAVPFSSAASLNTQVSSTGRSAAGKRKRDAHSPSRPPKIARKERREGAQSASFRSLSYKSSATSSSTSVSHSTSFNATGATGKRKRDDCSGVSTSRRPLKTARREDENTQAEAFVAAHTIQCRPTEDRKGPNSISGGQVCDF
ncbi:hypothetical protein CYLTODRAFT_456145 [Cylindrobasidium torrendii FP15055 ss-10]|uniref:Uncharacterized protein n=1 Tax=Cylindrobasidium torrendii FP15055 ss-10 TaxID=1314674 RepID=A0A0D7B601_9AGAR|nr:hypothetical protein CYLTODRAFT_456145 [Cylindrobasidium torrendii FP15055 ss-10]